MWYLKTGVERADCQQIVYKLVRFLVMVIRERERDVWYLKTGVERADCQQIVYKLVMFSRTEPTSFALAEQPLRLQTTYITGIHF